ncbi:STAS domain-containing protein [Thiobacter aerophilum]|uniref:STAS domain-containing protein n=1 Tax=Thiobacter aerophilum TaxID=3121275 RepID=A0ABV0EFF7_9BURK
MNLGGIHLTRVGGGAMLAEPSRALDLSDTAFVLEAILAQLHKHRADRLYYDLADVPVIDTVHYAWLESLARACRAINVRMICIHMQPTAAFGLATFLQDPPSFDTALDMEAR